MGNTEQLRAVEEVRKSLFALRDEGYQKFHAALIPTVPNDRIIGVRIPVLRKLAREMATNRPQQVRAFLSVLPHGFYEEDMLHGLLIEREKTFAEAKARLDEFLPFVDNWAVTDATAPKALKKDPAALQDMISEYLKREEEYVVRYGIVSAMRFYEVLPDKSAAMDEIASLSREEYYIKMGAAWFFATVYALDRERAKPYFIRGIGDKFTHNKAIQKARESFRISDEDKAFLTTLKRV